MSVHSLEDKKEQTEYYKQCLEIAKFRWDCYQAHIDIGFAYEDAILFTQLDTKTIVAGLEEPEEQGEMIVFVPDTEAH